MRDFLDRIERERIRLGSPLSLSTSYRFPLQSEQARREVLWGAALLLLLPGVGWILNMGHRIEMVHRMHHGQEPWPAWTNYRRLWRNALFTFLGMLYYYSPGALLLYFGYPAPGRLLLMAATVAIPGYMTHYCKNFEVAEIFNPGLALSRVFQGGLAYWKAWGIALSALALSFVGLFFGLGFLVSSVWFWQVAGFSFASVFTQRFELGAASVGGGQTRPQALLSPRSALDSGPDAP